ncbi:MAG: CapA family protein [Fibromonadaceae bacterium]|nr:CapA family protein [Fibromonadaceae bacterium]
MFRKTFIFVFFLLSFVFAQESTLRLIFAGDLMGHSTQINAANREAGGKGYDYKPFFKYLKPYFSSADLAVINLEYSLAGEPYSGYPQFSSPDESIIAIQDAGFGVIATSNNHSLDRGKQGLERTIRILDSLKLKHFGMYRDTVEKDNNYPLFIEENGIKIAFLNYTYGTNMLVEEAPNIVNRIDTAQIAADIKKAKLKSPDFIIAFMHWGSEYNNTENEEQRELAKFMALEGVNLIVGSHPHVVQPFSKIFVPDRDSVPVIYSLGNFFSNQRPRYRDGGIIFDVTLQKNAANDNKTTVSDYGYMPFWVYRFTRKGGYTFRLLPECKRTEAPCKGYKMSKEDRAAMELFFKDTRGILKNLPKISISPSK